MEHKVLCTKKLDTALVQKAADHKIDLRVQEFISIRSLWTPELYSVLSMQKENIHAVAFTSANAVSILNENFIHSRGNHLNWKIYCLSSGTRKAVEAAGFTKQQIHALANDGKELSEKIILAGEKEIYFFCGDKRRDILPVVLPAAGIMVHEFVLYESTFRKSELTDQPEAVMFFSPSAVQSFFQKNSLNENSVCFAIGPTTAYCIQKHSSNQIITSRTPDASALLDEVIGYFQMHKTNH